MSTLTEVEYKDLFSLMLKFEGLFGGTIVPWNT